MEILRSTDETEKLVLSLHKAISLGCPLIVESEHQIIKLKEFRLGMLSCTNCKLIREDCEKVKIYTFDEFKEAVSSDEIKNLNNLVINNIQKFIENFIGSKLSTLYITSD